MRRDSMYGIRYHKYDSALREHQHVRYFDGSKNIHISYSDEYDETDMYKFQDFAMDSKKMAMLLYRVGTMIISEIKLAYDNQRSIHCKNWPEQYKHYWRPEIVEWFTEHEARNLQIAAGTSSIGWRKFVKACHIFNPGNIRDHDTKEIDPTKIDQVTETEREKSRSPRKRKYRFPPSSKRSSGHQEKSRTWEPIETVAKNDDHDIRQIINVQARKDMATQEKIDNCYAATEYKYFGKCKGCYKKAPLIAKCIGCQFTNDKGQDLCEECKVCQKCKDVIGAEIYAILNSPFNIRNPPSRNAIQQMAEYHDTEYQ